MGQCVHFFQLKDPIWCSPVQILEMLPAFICVLILLILGAMFSVVLQPLWLLQSFCFLSPKGRDLIEQFNKIKKYPFIEFYLILLFICHLEASVIHNFYPSICMYIFCVSISYVKVCLITQVCTLMKALYSEVWNSSSSSLILWADGRDFTPEIFIEETELTCHIFIIPLE